MRLSTRSGSGVESDALLAVGVLQEAALLDVIGIWLGKRVCRNYLNESGWRGNSVGQKSLTNQRDEKRTGSSLAVDRLLWVELDVGESVVRVESRKKLAMWR